MKRSGLAGWLNGNVGAVFANKLSLIPVPLSLFVPKEVKV